MGSTDKRKPHPLAERPIFSDEQLSRYVASLEHQPTLTLSAVKASIQNNPLLALTDLQRLTANLSPWGSLGLHYSPYHILSLDKDVLFTKIVESRQGGYCMENNAFFSTVLRSLGYDLYPTGARVAGALVGEVGIAAEGYKGWGHQVIIVKIDSAKYLVDVGLGGQGSLEPLKLEEGATSAGSPGVIHRLVRKTIAPFTHQDQQMWVVEFFTSKTSADFPQDAQLHKDDGWKPAYCFDDKEWLPQDFEPISFSKSTNPKSMFVQTLMLSKPLLSEDGSQAIGQVTLVGSTITRRMLRTDKESWTVEKEELRNCKSEEERIDGLERWFGVQLRDHEKRSIVGLASHIRPPAAGLD
jgi:arylamine N-acetyltransferase